MGNMLNFTSPEAVGGKEPESDDSSVIILSGSDSSASSPNSSSSSTSSATPSSSSGSAGSSPEFSTANMEGLLNWNPIDQQIRATPPTAAALRRVKREMENYLKEPVEGIHFVLDDEEANLVHALIVGPTETPYEGGFFYFLLRPPPTYPFKPPLVKLMTTGNSTVRFNPNLYECGKVCLSILGTWPGPAWTPNLTIRSVLLSIQSLMSKEPYFNEPGFEPSRGTPAGKKASGKYSEGVLYETMRVAVIGMMEEGNLESKDMPKELKDKMKEIFASKLDYYTAVLVQNKEKGSTKSKFDYQALKGRFDALVLVVKGNGKRAATPGDGGGGDEDGPTAAKKARKGKK